MTTKTTLTRRILFAALAAMFTLAVSAGACAKDPGQTEK
jgi:hypothetical protein